MNTIILEELAFLASFLLIPFILHYFFSHFFTCRIQQKWKLALLYALYVACYTALRYSSMPDMLMLIVNTGLIILLSFLYRGDFKWKGYSALFITAVVFLGDTVIPLAYTETGYVASLFLSKLLVLLLVFVLLRVARGDGSGHLDGWYWSLLLLCPFLSILGLLRLSNLPFFQDYPGLFPIVPTLMLAINFLIFVLSDRMMYIQGERNQRLLLEQQNAYYVNQYYMNREKQEEAAKLQHDLRHILLGLRADMLTGEASSAQELDRLLGRVDHRAGSCNTGNLVIDSIINYKEQAAGKLVVPFRLDLNIPPLLKLDATVISVILGNILDNAIEACQALDEAQRYISIHMHYLNESLFLRVQNPYSHEIRTNLYGKIRSTKPDPDAHGIGLSNIRQTVDQAGGLLDVSYDGENFQVEIVLFHIERG